MRTPQMVATNILVLSHSLLALKLMDRINTHIQIRASSTEVAVFYASLGSEVEVRLGRGIFMKPDTEKSL